MILTFSNLKPVLNRKKEPCLRFSLTTESSVGVMGETSNGCLAGRSKGEPWAMPPASPYKNYIWARDFEDAVLKGLASKGLLDGLGTPFEEVRELQRTFSFEECGEVK